MSSSVLQELAGGVVGEDLAAGLARGAVAHRVAAVLTERIVSPQTGQASPVRRCTRPGRSFDELMSRARARARAVGDGFADAPTTGVALVVG